MKKIVLLLALCGGFAHADTYVQGHMRKDGTYVQGHMRSSPDGNPYNNYSTQGNINPHTGQEGRVNPYNANSGNIGWDSPQLCGVDAYGNRVCR